jgi:Flp pilus assembly protein TadB
MAQTKRKRRSKHRGNAAGTIETRGRTGRPPSADEKKKDDRTKAREARLYTPPTWRTSVKRAGIASALMFLFLFVTNTKNTLAQRLVAAVLFAVGAFVLYTAIGYYTDLFLYRRRIRKREAGE